MIRQGILRQIALITNKFLQSTQIQCAADILWYTTQDLLKKEALAENSVRVLFWISKALLLRLAKTGEVLEQLLSLLSDSRHGLAIGRGFGILLAPDELLSKQNGAIIRLLANQRIFNYCIPRFAESIRQAEDAAKRNYLIALSGILKYTGTDILMADVDTLLPLLLQSLDLEASEVKSATIESLIVISQQSAQAIEEHIPSVINRLLNSTVRDDINDLVRFSNRSPHNHSKMMGLLINSMKTESPLQRGPLFATIPHQGQRKRITPVSHQSHQRSHDRAGRSKKTCTEGGSRV